MTEANKEGTVIQPIKFISVYPVVYMRKEAIVRGVGNTKFPRIDCILLSNKQYTRVDTALPWKTRAITREWRPAEKGVAADRHVELVFNKKHLTIETIAHEAHHAGEVAYVWWKRYYGKKLDEYQANEFAAVVNQCIVKELSKWL